MPHEAAQRLEVSPAQLDQRLFDPQIRHASGRRGQGEAQQRVNVLGQCQRDRVCRRVLGGAGERFNKIDAVGRRRRVDRCQLTPDASGPMD